MFYQLVRPLLFCLDPEKAHHLTLTLLKKGLAPKDKSEDDPALTTTIAGLNFSNPIGLAAGFDKQAEVIDEVLSLGFGFTEVGSITPLPQPGNAKPRLFRLPQAEAVINRFGFNSDGFDECQRRLAACYDSHTRDRRGLVGANIGKNKTSKDAVADYVAGVKKFASCVDYLAINISSPNTPGLRDLQTREQLAELLKAVMAARNAENKKPPVFVKIAPDQTEAQQEDIAEVVLASCVQGIIIGNTTVARPGNLPQKLAQEAGGLSGKPLFEMSTQLLAQMYKKTGGKIPLIGCGGVSSGADAYAKIRAGASLVQLYTGLIYHGPGLVKAIKRDLVALLKRDGFTSVNQAVGSAK